MPLLPAFETESEGFKSTALYTILHYVYRSLFRGQGSLFESLRKLNIDPFKYIFIGSLRNFGWIGKKLFTEQIYVHSKVLIVDDRYTIIGSSNINDRSMLGFRDSEIGCYLEDEKFRKCVVEGGKELDVGYFSSSLRKALMAEHLGIVKNGVYPFDLSLLDDPVQESFFVHVWSAIAKKNTGLFDEIFGCVPADYVNTLSNFNKQKSNKTLLDTNPELAMKNIKIIQGHLVTFPTNFLSEENLEPAFATRERMVPIETWL